MSDNKVQLVAWANTPRPAPKKPTERQRVLKRYPDAYAEEYSFTNTSRVFWRIYSGHGLILGIGDTSKEAWQSAASRLKDNTEEGKK